MASPATRQKRYRPARGLEPGARLARIQRHGELIPNIPFHVVARHPLADEREWLIAHDMTPAECRHVDLYWALDDMLAFVWINADLPHLPVGATYYRERERNRHIQHTFGVRLQAGPVHTHTVVTALTWLSGWIAEHRVVMRAMKRDIVLRIADYDITQ